MENSAALTESYCKLGNDTLRMPLLDKNICVVQQESRDFTPHRSIVLPREYHIVMEFK